MVRPTLALLALLIPQGLLASEVHVSAVDPQPELVLAGTLLRTSAVPVRTAFVEPFQKNTSATPVRFDVDALRSIRLEIVSMDGEVVKTLASGLWAQGRHELAWYGVDENGAAVADGPYAVRLSLVDDAPAVALLTGTRF
jgi:hypothetical protein